MVPLSNKYASVEKLDFQWILSPFHEKFLSDVEMKCFWINISNKYFS